MYFLPKFPFNTMLCKHVLESSKTILDALGA